MLTRHQSTRRGGIVVVLLLCHAGLRAADAPSLQVNADLPAGNIIVEKIEGDTVQLRQDLRDTQGPWFYWCFRVQGAAGRTLTFRFTNGDVIAAQGPAVSSDGGKNWRWLKQIGGAGHTFTARSFTYRFAPADGDVRFCFAIPYTQSNWQDFLARHEKAAGLTPGVLCESRKGRKVPTLQLGPPPGEARFRLAFTCRHHACESLASFVFEGLLDAMLGDDDLGRWCRQSAAVLVIPFVDFDGVEDGDQGKNRKPHDQNRDYGDAGLYPEVAAIKELLPQWSGRKLNLAMDLHCPYRTDTVIQFIGGQDAEDWKQVGRLSELLEKHRKGPLPFAAADNLPFGQKWNNQAGAASFKRWAEAQPWVGLATTLEFPYAQVKGATVTTDNARAFGKDLAAALRAHLESR